MNKDFIKGINIALGILLVFSLVGLVSAVGFHYANEILPGTFTGNYIFNGDVNITSGKDLCIDGGKCLSTSGSVSGITTSAGTCATGNCDLRNYDGSGSGIDADLLDGVGSTTASTANTIAKRDGSGDINARLFRSEYDSTNPTINYVMTQIDTGTNNYIRPSTIAQLKTALDVSPITCSWVGERAAYGNGGGCFDDLYVTCTSGIVVSMRMGC